MIIIDFNGIALGAIVTQKMDINEDMVRHMVLNSIRMYNKKFRDEYGDVVIACDGGSWRRDYFPQYKWKRRQAREDDNADKSKLDWNEVFEILNKVRDELVEYFPYKVVHIPGVEADDIIGTLVEETQEFGKHDDVMIVSSDKDFIQLQKYNNVRQFSPMTKKFIQEKNPRQYLMEHLFKGDSGDGVPNVLSGDNTFVDGIRQSPVTKKKIEHWMENVDNLQDAMGEEIYRNFVRNKKLIDLSETPVEIKESIINTYEGAKVAPKMRILNYLIKNRCRQLVECVGDFH
jgi:5'-3' exonuclease